MLVHTIEEIRNTSLCNLFFSNSSNDLTERASSAAPQVPPRLQRIDEGCSVKSVTSHTLVMSDSSSEPRGRKRKSPLTTVVGSRKNILELAGGSTDLFNSPPSSLMTSPVAREAQPLEQQQSTPVEGSLAAHIRLQQSLSLTLSPSSKYESPTPPRPFVRNSEFNRPMRKISLRREATKPVPDLYQNISDNLLSERPCERTSTTFLDSKGLVELRADDKYERRRDAGRASLRDKPSLGEWCRQAEPQRRSFSVSGKENCLPPPQLGPKPKSGLRR
jgi:hypothetical protein